MSWKIHWIIALIAALTGCAEDAPTRVLVFLDAEDALAEQADTLEVEVFDRDGALVGDIARFRIVEEPSAPDEAALPLGLTVLPRDGDASTTFTVEGRLVDPMGSLLVSQRAIGEYVAGEVLELQLIFDAACTGVVCTEVETCQNGVCVEPCVLPTSLGALSDRRSPPVSCPDTRECPIDELPTCVDGRLHTCSPDGVHTNAPCPAGCGGDPAACL